MISLSLMTIDNPFAKFGTPKEIDKRVTRFFEAPNIIKRASALETPSDVPLSTEKHEDVSRKDKPNND